MIKSPPASAGDMGSSLVQQDPTCLRAAKAMSPCPRTCALQQEKLAHSKEE